MDYIIEFKDKFGTYFNDCYTVPDSDNIYNFVAHNIAPSCKDLDILNVICVDSFDEDFDTLTQNDIRILTNLVSLCSSILKRERAFLKTTAINNARQNVISK